MRKVKIAVVAGARPNFMKVAPLISELNKIGAFDTVLVHTGQHYDREMSAIFFKELGLPAPDKYLGVGSASHAVQTARVMKALEKYFLKLRPDLAVVVGDVNSTLAASVVCSKMLIPVAHVEAGLRSFDRTMPEEINRIVTDSLSSYLFTTSPEARINLLKEGAKPAAIYFTGNVMIDTLKKLKKAAERRNTLAEMELNKNGYALLTLHRPSNVDDRESFVKIIKALKYISTKLTVVFPAHPRTVKQLSKFGLAGLLKGADIRLIKPAGYLDFLNLMANSKFVLTDSGGIQEETTVLGIPCLTLRNNTERPITVSQGTNLLVGGESSAISAAADKILNNSFKKAKIPRFWDGKAAVRIASILKREFSNRK